MRYSTQKCSQHGHPEISLECDASVPDSALNWLLAWLETEVSSGKHFLPEKTVQIGWSILQVRQRTDGSLTLFEPDFHIMPIVFVDSVSNTLAHTLIQKYTAESLGLENELSIPPLTTAPLCAEHLVLG